MDRRCLQWLVAAGSLLPPSIPEWRREARPQAHSLLGIPGGLQPLDLGLYPSSSGSWVPSGPSAFLNLCLLFLQLRPRGHAEAGWEPGGPEQPAVAETAQGCAAAAAEPWRPRIR